MGLQLPSNFKSDIETNDLSLVPVVVIGTFGSHDEVGGFHPTSYKQWIQSSYVFSTNSINVNQMQNAEWKYSKVAKPILMNVPNIRQGIDVNNRSYKVSNVSIEISNLPHNGKRFADIIDDKFMQFAECRIFWFSKSSEWAIPYDMGAHWYNGAMQVFNGIVTGYSINNNTIRIEVEDKSLSKIDKDLTTEYFPLDDSMPQRYKGVIKPIVYGYVEKSPCVLELSNPEEYQTATNFLLHSEQDASVIVPVNENTGNLKTDYVYFYEEDNYFSVKWDNLLFTNEFVTQYTNNGGVVEVIITHEDTEEEDAEGNSIAQGFIEARIHKTPMAGSVVDSFPYTYKTVQIEGCLDESDFWACMDFTKK